jgi:putative ABC transport system substrate-binding protein
LEYLRAVVASLSRVGVLIDPKHPNHPTLLKQVQLAAQASNVSVFRIELPSVGDIEATFDAIKRERLGALIVPPDPTFPIIYPRITALALGNHLATMFGQREGVEAGGLMSYAPDPIDMYKRAAALVDKILKGSRPAEIPVEFPTRFAFVINLKTAKALGLGIPPSLLAEADDVME